MKRQATPLDHGAAAVGCVPRVMHGAAGRKGVMTWGILDPRSRNLRVGRI